MKGDTLAIRGHDTIGQIRNAYNRWHLAVAVYEPAGKVARNGCTSMANWLPRTRSPSVHLGNSKPVLLGYAIDEQILGLIDEVAIFGRAISAEEVGAMFQAGNPAASPAENTAELQAKQSQTKP